MRIGGRPRPRFPLHSGLSHDRISNAARPGLRVGGLCPASPIHRPSRARSIRRPDRCTGREGAALAGRAPRAQHRRRVHPRRPRAVDEGVRRAVRGRARHAADTRRFAQNKLGTPWEALASRYVFQPFGMASTSNTRRDWFAGRVAVPYGREGRYGEPSIQDSALASDDLYTTVGDYAAFVAGVMNREGLPAAFAAQRDSAHVANEAAAARCDRTRVTHCARVGMGLGWEVLEYPGESVRLHTGGDWGESTLAFYIAERREGAVMLTNGAAGMMVMLRAVDLLFPGTWLAEEVRSYY
ncbi:MAG TPA: serine hydrolase domain-containing protein [Longimicrobium sp.]